MIEISSGALSASIDPLGAELSSLRTADGAELMTDADPAFWAGRAPLLFPIVGALNGGVYRLDGREYPLPQHGFARRQPFACVDHTPDRAVFRLTDNEETRAVYPFAFALDAAFTLRGPTLTMDVTVTNRGAGDMPASFGFHPAFAWEGGGSVEFEKPEPSPLAGLGTNGLIGPDAPSPLDGRTLPLSHALFESGALIWPRVESRSVRFGDLDIGFDCPMLGIWTKPGARFVCIEPWHGIADPEGFEGEIWDKPGMMRFAPGAARTFSMQVTLSD
ncbi:aldose 1-epimerase family protein [Sphingomonas soli]|uniref:aldose 1-epimerase family protein n=1 Tax=Sphingomonas soli TaxID=266127 RepID=UPI00083008C4|nr:aldose 1-epimerase family protein [Sphingomonas soli]